MCSYDTSQCVKYSVRPGTSSFVRHEQIYRPMLSFSKRDGLATVPLSSSDEFATGYSLASCSPALLASPPMVKGIAGNRQPPLDQGLGNFHPAK